MYYEEKIIGGIMHYRANPDDLFMPYTIEELSRRYEEMKRRYNESYYRAEAAVFVLQGKALHRSNPK